MARETSPLAEHPERNVIRLQLKQLRILEGLGDDDRAALEPGLTVIDAPKGEFLLLQGVRDMMQYFVLGGILKRVVANPDGKEMILRFADERDMETSYAAWRTGTPTPYGIVCVTKARVACLPLPEWVDFLESRPQAKQQFEYDVMLGMTEIMAHTITLHLLDAPGRVHRFLRKHPELVDRIPKKELASYLNIAPETLSRLRHSGKV
ncbi:MAG: Crp/Fnr family transcriptional regulator [Leptothrix sp. (in: Bacteria)]|nr:Crp/Fnr family transcriptional regulator [Leptothrix sp. (in: b-proteobacteria)]